MKMNDVFPLALAYALAEALRLQLDLAGQLAGGRHDQHGRRSSGSAAEEVCEGRQQKGQGLAAAGLCNAHHITASTGYRPAVGL